jgi:hypothetical protein
MAAAYQSVGTQHREGPAWPLLGGLEHQGDRLGFRVTRLQQTSRSRRGGGVKIVPTGMHPTRDLGPDGEVAVLLQRKGIHVPPQHQGEPRSVRAQIARHVGAGQPAVGKVEVVKLRLRQADVSSLPRPSSGWR